MSTTSLSPTVTPPPVNSLSLGPSDSLSLSLSLSPSLSTNILNNKITVKYGKVINTINDNKVIDLLMSFELDSNVIGYNDGASLASLM